MVENFDGGMCNPYCVISLSQKKWLHIPPSKFSDKTKEALWNKIVGSVLSYPFMGYSNPHVEQPWSRVGKIFRNYAMFFLLDSIYSFCNISCIKVISKVVEWFCLAKIIPSPIIENIQGSNI